MWIFENKKMWLYAFKIRICGHTVIHSDHDFSWKVYVICFPPCNSNNLHGSFGQKLRPATTPAFRKSSSPRTCRNMYGTVACVLGRFTAAKQWISTWEFWRELTAEKKTSGPSPDATNVILEDLPTKLVHLYAFIRLAGGLKPSEKYEFVSWDDEIPNWMGK